MRRGRNRIIEADSIERYVDDATRRSDWCWVAVLRSHEELRWERDALLAVAVAARELLGVRMDPDNAGAVATIDECRLAIERVEALL